MTTSESRNPEGSPETIYVWFVTDGENTRIRKWDYAPFDNGVPYTRSETAKPDSAPVKNGNAFRRELAALMNRYSLENGSDTPDYMLADYLIQCLRALDSTVNEREVWYGREKKVPTAGERPEGK